MAPTLGCIGCGQVEPRRGDRYAGTYVRDCLTLSLPSLSTAGSMAWRAGKGAKWRNRGGPLPALGCACLVAAPLKPRSNPAQTPLKPHLNPAQTPPKPRPEHASLTISSLYTLHLTSLNDDLTNMLKKLAVFGLKSGATTCPTATFCRTRAKMSIEC